MKNIFYILLLLPTIIFAQYPSNSGQKITLGEQTSADGLVWRGRTSDTANLMTNKLDTSVYLVLDTMTKAMWLYRVTTTPKWNRVVDSLNNMQGQLSLTTKVTGVLPVANGGTGASTFTAGSIVFAGASGTYTQANEDIRFITGDKRLILGPNTVASPETPPFSGVRFKSMGKIQIARSDEDTRFITIDNEAGEAKMDFKAPGAGYGSFQFTQSNNTTTRNLMIFNGSGNVGIGTTLPGAKLETLATTEQLRLSYDATNYLPFTVNSSGGVTVGRTGAITPKNLWTMQSRFTADGDAQLTLAPNIRNNGTTINGSVYGLKIAATHQDESGGDEVVNYYGIYVLNPTGIGSVTNVYGAYFQGNVGIGTASPANLLHLYGTDCNSYLRWTSNLATTGTRIGYNGTEFRIDQQQNADVTIRTNSIERMRITSDGNVNIGTSISTGILTTGSATIGNINAKSFLLGTTGTELNYRWQTYLVSDNYTVYGRGYGDALSISYTTGAVKIFNLATGTVTSSSGTLSATSDMNLKISDGYIDNALDKIMNLKPRYFYWKEETGLPTNIRQLGFYAQEVNQSLGEEAANTPKNENDKYVY